MTLITKNRYCEQTGIPPTTVKNWIYRHLESGKHYVVQGRTTLINVEEMEQWLISQGASDRTAQACKSASSTRSAPIPKTPGMVSASLNAFQFKRLAISGSHRIPALLTKLDRKTGQRRATE